MLSRIAIVNRGEAAMRAVRATAPLATPTSFPREASRWSRASQRQRGRRSQKPGDNLRTKLTAKHCEDFIAQLAPERDAAAATLEEAQRPGRDYAE